MLEHKIKNGSRGFEIIFKKNNFIVVIFYIKMYYFKIV